MRILEDDVKIEKVSVKQTWAPLDIRERLEFENGGVLVNGEVVEKVVQSDKITGIKNVKKVKLVVPS